MPVIKTKIESLDNSYQKKSIGFIIVILSFIIIVLIIPATNVDWRISFFPVSKALLNPYSIKSIFNPPWMLIFLLPFRFFSENTSAFLNAFLNIFVIGVLVFKRKGDLISLMLTFTSIPFLALLSNGNIEWIPALGFIFQNAWGVPFLLVKPQSGFLAIYSWFIKSKNKLRFFIPIIIIIFISFLIWGNWINPIVENVKIMNALNSNHNISLFPWTIPLGVGLIFYILKFKPVETEIFGILATLCFIPYFASQSLVILYTLISVSHRRIGLILWLILWLLFFI